MRDASNSVMSSDDSPSLCSAALLGSALVLLYLVWHFTLSPPKALHYSILDSGEMYSSKQTYRLDDDMIILNNRIYVRD